MKKTLWPLISLMLFASCASDDPAMTGELNSKETEELEMPGSMHYAIPVTIYGNNGNVSKSNAFPCSFDYVAASSDEIEFFLPQESNSEIEAVTGWTEKLFTELTDEDWNSPDDIVVERKDADSNVFKAKFAANETTRIRRFYIRFAVDPTPELKEVFGDDRGVAYFYVEQQKREEKVEGPLDMAIGATQDISLKYDPDLFEMLHDYTWLAFYYLCSAEGGELNLSRRAGDYAMNYVGNTEFIEKDYTGEITDPDHPLQINIAFQKAPVVNESILWGSWKDALHAVRMTTDRFPKVDQTSPSSIKLTLPANKSGKIRYFYIKFEYQNTPADYNNLKIDRPYTSTLTFIQPSL